MTARKDRSSSRRPERGGRGSRPPKGADRGARPPKGADRGPRPPKAADRDASAAERLPRDRMVVYGRNAVREALRGRRAVHRIWATAGAASADWPRAIMVDGDEIAARSGSDAHQGVCAEVDPYPYADAADLLARPDPLIVALDEVTDPQNLGAVCRTAECARATGVVVPERRSAEVTPAVCKASAGAVEHLPVAQVRNLADFLGEAKGAGVWCYGAAAGARTDYVSVDWAGGVVIVLGAEGKGLRPRVAAACDDLVALPLLGRIDSLNVSATAAVLLYRILQFRLDTST